MKLIRTLFLSCLLLFTSCSKKDNKLNSKQTHRGFKEILGFYPSRDYSDINYYIDQGFADSVAILKFSFSSSEDIEKLINQSDLEKVEPQKISEMTGKFPVWWDEKPRVFLLSKEETEDLNMQVFHKKLKEGEVIVWIMPDKHLAFAQKIRY
ncbi:MAG: hypothetical protein AAFN93_17555 [Bacteroidota bacterium]